MQKSAKPIDRVSKLALQGLKARGYRKRADEIFTLEISGQVLGWVGLNRAVSRGDGNLEIHPFIGVRHQELERKLADLRSQPFHEYIPPSIRTHLMYLVLEGDYLPWLFGEEMKVEPRVEAMVEQIDALGRPFMQQHISLEELAHFMESGRGGNPESRAFRLPVLYLLMGKKERALEWVDCFQLELRERTDLAAAQYHEFADALREELGRSS